MRNLPILAILAAGCAQTQAPPAGSDERDQELGAVLLMAYDPAHLRVGQRVLYSVVREGEAQPRYLQLQCVAAGAGDTLWVELKLPVDPRPMIVKSRLDRTGRLHEQWVGEPGSRGPAQTYPRADGRTPEPPRPARDSRADVSVADETVTVAGRPYLCKKVTTTLSYAGGRSTALVNWCHPDVPFSYMLGSDSLGGVVKRTYGKYRMELVSASQTGARSELEVPGP